MDNNNNNIDNEEQFSFCSWNINYDRRTQEIPNLKIESRLPNIVRDLCVPITSVYRGNETLCDDIITLQEVPDVAIEYFKKSPAFANHDIISMKYQLKPDPKFIAGSTSLLIIIRKDKFFKLEEIKTHYSLDESSFLSNRAILGLKVKFNSPRGKSFFVFTSHLPLGEQEKWECLKVWEDTFSKISEPIVFGVDTNFFFDLSGSDMYDQSLKIFSDASFKKIHSENYELSDRLGYEDFEFLGSFFGYSCDPNRKSYEHKQIFEEIWTTQVLGPTPLDRIFFRDMKNGKCYIDSIPALRPRAYLAYRTADDCPSDHGRLSCNFWV